MSEEVRVSSLRDAQAIVEMLLAAVLSEAGLTDSLGRFRREEDGAAGRFAQSLFEGLTHGESFEGAIRQARPSLPGVLQELLILGCEHGNLDYILGEIVEGWRAVSPGQDWAARLDELLLRWRSRTANLTICTGCLEREIGRIPQRAKVEGAREVILEQEGEAFFHQWYVAAKPVHVIEPSHSMTYRTILQALSDADGASEGLKPWEVRVRSVSPRRFRLVGEGVALEMFFR
jgi:hypothetical protein